MAVVALGTLAVIAIAAADPAAMTTLPAEMEQIGKYELAYPYPSPDGQQVAFQSNMDGRWQLYALNTGDGSIRRLHSSASDDRNPAWSPDGTKIAFVSTRDGNDEVYVLELATGVTRSVSPHPGRDGHPKWSPDGQWLVFNRTFDPADKEGDESDIVRVREEGSQAEVISDTPEIETFPSFSPDGGSVVFVEWHPDADGAPARNGELIIVDLETKERRNITNSFAFDGYPHWGSSGEWIYFSSATEGGPKGREALIYRIHPDGTGLARLTALDGIDDVRAIPTDDEKTIYFNRDDGGRVFLYKMDLPTNSPAKSDASGSSSNSR
ncbi:MAG: TolB family protein [Sphingomicrobium sp.]